MMWEKVYDVEVVWMDEVFTETLTLLTRQRSAVKPVLLPLRGGSISVLYLGLVPFLSLNNFPLHVASNIKVIA